MNTYIVTMSDGGEEVRIKAGAMTVEDNVYCFGDTKGVPLNRPMWVLLGSSPVSGVQSAWEESAVDD